MVRPQPFSPAQLRRLGPFFVVLFVLAQAAGIAPLMSIHIQHALRDEQNIAVDLGQSGRTDHLHHRHACHDSGKHEHGASDPGDQCCTLHHHLAGVIPIAVSPGRSRLTLSIVGAPPGFLTGTDPGRLERPPKLRLPI